MNTLDIVITLSVFFLSSFLVLTEFKFSKVRLCLAIVFDALLLIQLLKQGLRWNYFAIYVLGFLFMPWLLLKVKNNPSFHFVMPLKIMTGIILTMSIFLIYAFPIPRLTTPKGNYAVGTTIFDVQDASRMETYSDMPNSKRKFMFQVWYPTDASIEQDKAPWLVQGKAVSKGFARLGKLPEFAFNQLRLVPSNAYLNAPIASGFEKYPIIIMSHGWSSSRLLHVNMAEELASNGYVVIGIEHTYGSAVTAFSDGTISEFSTKTLPSTDYSPELLVNGNRLIKTFAGDISYLINKLEAFDKGDSGPDVLKGRLDLDKIGLIGHSTGGGAAVLTAIEDERVKSILTYDPWVEPLENEKFDVKFKIPTLFLRSDEWQNGTNDPSLLKLSENWESALYQVHGAMHSDFTLMYQFTPLTKLFKRLGPIDGDMLSRFQGDLSVAFFNQTLLNLESDSLDVWMASYPFLEKIR